MEVNEVLLPGVGLRYEFDTADGDRIGIVALRDGSFLVAVYDARDPDEPVAQYRLNDEESDAVAQILGAPRMAERFAAGRGVRRDPRDRRTGAGEVPRRPR
jgi:TrkA domain protein